MKLLDKEIRHNGFTFKQVYRDGDWAIYRQTKGDVDCYELIKVQKHDGYKIMGKDIPASEFYPSAEAWGLYGWSLPTLSEAHFKLKTVSTA